MPTFRDMEIEIDVAKAGTTCRALRAVVTFDVDGGIVENMALSSQVKGEPDAVIDRRHWLYPYLLDAIYRTYADEIGETEPRERSDLEEHGTHWQEHRGY